MANTTVKGKFKVVAENGDVQTIYPKTTGDQVLVDRSSNASVIPNDVANLQHIVNKMGSLALKSKVETSDFTTGTMISSLAGLKSNTDTGKIADATVVKDIENRVDTLENSNFITVDEFDAGLATKPDTEINDSVTSTSLTWSSKKLSDQLTTLNSNTSVLTSRIDNIIAHNNDTEGNSELIDIRTGADGIVFNSAGKAVRQQFTRSFKKLDDIRNDIYSTVTTENLYYDGLPTANLNVYDTGTFHAGDSYLGVIIPIQSSNGIITIKRKNIGGTFRVGTSVNLPQDGVSVSQCVTYDSGNHITITPDANDRYLYLAYYKSTGTMSLSDSVKELKVFYGTQWTDGTTKLDAFIEASFEPLSVFVDDLGEAVLKKLVVLKKLDDICNDIYSTVTTENLYYDGLPTANLNVYDAGTFHAGDSYLGVIIPIQSSNGIITIKRKNIGDTFRVGTSVELPANGVSVSRYVTYDAGNHITITPDANDRYLYLAYYKSTGTMSLSDSVEELKVFYGTQWTDGTTKLDAFIEASFEPLSVVVDDLEEAVLKKLDDIRNDIYSTVPTENLYYDGLPTANLNVYDTGTFHAGDSYLGVIIPIQSSNGIITIKRKNIGGTFRVGTSVNLPQDGVSVSRYVTYDAGNHMTITPDANDRYLYLAYYKSTGTMSLSDSVEELKVFYGTQWTDGTTKLDAFLEKPDIGNVLFIGDSYTADSYQGNPNGWINALAEYCDFSRKKIGVGSSSVKDKYNDRTTYSYTDRPSASELSGNLNTFACQIEELKRLIAGTDLDAGETKYTDIPDIIFIQGGTNDIADTAQKEEAYEQQFYIAQNAYYAKNGSSEVQQGTVYVKPDVEQIDRTSFAGAIRYLYEELHTLYPDARIYFIAPPRLSYGTGNNIDSIKKAEQIKKVCAYLSIPVIDWGPDTGINYIDNYMTGSGTSADPYIIRNVTGYSIDCLHPNEKGAKILAKKVFDRIRNDIRR